MSSFLPLQAMLDHLVLLLWGQQALIQLQALHEVDRPAPVLCPQLKVLLDAHLQAQAGLAKSSHQLAARRPRLREAEQAEQAAAACVHMWHPFTMKSASGKPSMSTQTLPAHPSCMQHGRLFSKTCCWASHRDDG